LSNPWFTLPLAEYEAHMALPSIGQAQLIAGLLERLVQALSPTSVAVLGCAGGNGLERLVGTSIERVVALDINPLYVNAARERFRNRFSTTEFVVADIRDVKPMFEPVELIYAALIFEYVDLHQALRFMYLHCQTTGSLAAVLQMPSNSITDVTPSPYRSLRSLEPIMRLVAPDELRHYASETGFSQVSSRVLLSPGGKEFSLEEFQKGATTVNSRP